MASFDYRLNPLYAIKECSSCGALYTSDYCCSKGGIEDKILVPKTPNSSQRPPQDCVKCGNPVEGPNCQGCALWRKKLKEVWFTICHENGIYQDLLNTYESSDDDTNVVNAPREPFVVKQDPGENSSQSPPQINHNCCYECGDSLDGIFCQRCTCKSCGKGAHIGYNCPPKAPIISNPEPCNQTIDELPQTLPSFDPTCYSEKENSLPYVSKPNFVDDFPNIFNPPPQPPMYYCEFCENDARYGHYYTPQVPFIYPEPCYNQDFNFPQDFHDFQQQYLCCENCGGPHETFFDQFQPPQYTVNHPILNAQNELLKSQNKLMEQMTSIYDMIPIFYNDDDDEYSFATQEYLKKFSSAITPDLPKSDSLIMEDEQLDTISETESDELIKSSVEDLIHTPSESDGPMDEVLEYIILIPPGNGNDHFNAESSLIESVLNRDNVISSPKIDFLIEEFAGELALIAPIPPGIVEADLDPKEDIHFIENLMYDNSFPRPPETLKDDSETVIDSNNDYFLSDDDSYENIDYVDASPPDSEIVSLEVVEIVISQVGGIDTDILLTIKDDILREKLLNVNLLIANIEALQDNSTPSSDIYYFDDDHIEENSSGSTTTHADFSQYDSFIFDLSIDSFPPTDRSDFYHEEFAGKLAYIISPPEYDCFYFKSVPDLGEVTSIVDSRICENVLPTTNVNLPFEDNQSPLLAYVVWIFLPFLTYLVTPPYLLSCRNEDTIFDPGISVYHSFMPGISHRSGTFMKFNVYPNHLNESPMEILSSTCSSMDQ
ncbi:hypothetical protein Tco_1274713 [Tanacetum coccineum]